MYNHEEVKDFISKRNNVSLIKISDKLFIKKTFQTSELMQKELSEYLTIGKLGITAQIVDYGEQDGETYIILEYLDGATLYDIIMEEKLDEQTMRSIAVGIKNVIELTAACGRIITDVNYRNFVYRDGKIYLIDLEELEPLSAPKDVAIDEILQKIAVFGEKYTDRKSDNYEILKSLIQQQKN